VIPCGFVTLGWLCVQCVCLHVWHEINECSFSTAVSTTAHKPSQCERQHETSLLPFPCAIGLHFTLLLRKLALNSHFFIHWHFCTISAPAPRPSRMMVVYEPSSKSTGTRRNVSPGDLVPNMVSSSPTPSRGRTAPLACPPFSRFPLSRGLLSAVFQGSCHWQPPGNNKIPSTAEERRQLNWGVVMNAHTQVWMPHIHLLRLLGLHARQMFS